jgi:phosphatidylglycerol lysyltransferase
MPQLDDHERMRALILRYGWNSTCYQLLNPGFQYWFSDASDDIEAGAGYVEYARTRVVAGSPVSLRTNLERAVQQFEKDATDYRRHVCYFASEARLESCIASKPGYSVILLGAQPVWEPQVFVNNIAKSSSLRAQLHRASNKGTIAEEWPVIRATDNAELQRVLDEWLETRGLPSLHFLVEPQTLADLDGRRIFVATKHGRVVGFLNVSPIPERNGWLVEQFIRGRDAENGTIELLLERAARTLTQEGFTYFTLGLSPLTQQGGKQLQPVSPLIGFLLRRARAHGRRFYNFEGLEFFKTKFEPEIWEPIYAISNEPHFSLRSLYAIACAFTRGHPILTVLAGVGRAITQEVRWLFQSSKR